MRIIISCIILFIGISQAGTEIILPAVNFLPGWNKAGYERNFTTANLYGHINGGAEIFIEMGFDNLRLQKYKKDVQELAVEVYQMQSPESALGIYLLKSGKEISRTSIDARNSCNQYQYILCKGEFFIQIQNISGDSSLMTVMDKIANLLTSQIGMVQIELLKYLPDDQKIAQTERIIRGPFSLQSIYTLGAGDILNLQGKIFGVAADYQDNDDIFTRILIPYPDENLAKKTYLNLTENLDTYLEKISVGETSLLFKDYQGKYGYIRLKRCILEIDVGMKTEP